SVASFRAQCQSSGPEQSHRGCPGVHRRTRRQFRAILLDAGSYDVRVDAQGFAQSVYQNVTVNVGSAVNLEVTLQLGAAELEINVADTFLPIDLPNPTTTIDMTSIEDLPINGRRFQDFATLTPTVQVDQERGQLSFLGQRGIN